MTRPPCLALTDERVLNLVKAPARLWMVATEIRQLLCSTMVAEQSVAPQPSAYTVSGRLDSSIAAPISARIRAWNAAGEKD